MAKWPQRIPAQVLRMRLAAFKRELNDLNFRLLSCACCAREKRQCKLTRVCFPEKAAEVPPSWLEWAREDWRHCRDSCFEGLHNVLDVENYLRRFFQADARVADAEKEVLAFEGSTIVTSCFDSREAAEAWLRRVKLWRRNLRDSLTDDSVPAPGDPSVRWLLHKTEELRIDADTGSISCLLCRKCLQPLQGRLRRKAVEVIVRMLMQARTNGLWHGPDPEELVHLSYCESKVINMARVYISVKRVFFEKIHA